MTSSWRIQWQDEWVCFCVLIWWSPWYCLPWNIWIQVSLFWHSTIIHLNVSEKQWLFTEPWRKMVHTSALYILIKPELTLLHVSPLPPSSVNNCTENEISVLSLNQTTQIIWNSKSNIGRGATYGQNQKALDCTAISLVQRVRIFAIWIFFARCLTGRAVPRESTENSY